MLLFSYLIGAIGNAQNFAWVLLACDWNSGPITLPPDLKRFRGTLPLCAIQNR